MNAPLYTTEILRLAASLPGPERLERVDGTAEERSPTCGSAIKLEVQLDEEGRVQALTQRVHACAFGQASAALVAGGALGRSREEVERGLDEVAAWLAGSRGDPGGWPGLSALQPALPRRSRHGAILLPFRALLAAMERSRG